MKINITIEIDDNELKGLLFGEEKPKETKVKYIGYSESLARKLSNVARQLRDVAMCYGYATVADYKDILESEGLRGGMVTYTDNNMGWTFRELCNLQIALDSSLKPYLDMPPAEILP